MAVELPSIGADVDPATDFRADAAHASDVLDTPDRPAVLGGNSCGRVW
jgi:hypothetical protein